jgi:serine/threonine-protein kinase RsbW
MSPPARFTASYEAIPENVAIARRTVVSHLREAETSDPPLSDVALAVSEAATNAVTHGYVDREPGRFRIEVETLDDELEVLVEDDGRGMVPRPDSPGLGLGLPLIATVADRFETHTTPAGGTRLCMWFRLDPNAATLIN